MYASTGVEYEYTLGKHAPPSPVDQLLSLVTYGNAYRHADTGTKEWGAQVRSVLGPVPKMKDSKGNVSVAFEDYCEFAWLACFLHMVNFR